MVVVVVVFGDAKKRREMDRLDREETVRYWWHART